MKVAFELPTITDYGTLVELTAAQSFTGTEDGGSKLLIHHNPPTAPVG